jgi:MFS family permease
MGAVGGALMNARLRARFQNEWIARAAFTAFAIASVTLGLSMSAVLSGAALMLAGASWVITLSLFNVTIQLSTPRWVVGRAIALYQTGTFGGMAAGSWTWGVIAEGFGADRSMIVAAALLILGALVGLRVPIPDFTDLNLSPLNGFTEPPLRLDLKPRSGPIMIMIDYEIRQKDMPEFLEIMTTRRRIRIRDGAQQWALLRDLESPDIWTETYHVPTWVEYVRHHERRTQADAESYELLLKLHCGATRPKVHRMIERQTVSHHTDTPLKDDPGFDTH